MRLLPMPKANVTQSTNSLTVDDQNSVQANLSYEQALQELEQLVSRIETGSLPLDELLTGYQRGAQLLALCRNRLEAVQNQIQVLDDGVLQPWTGA